MKMTHKDALSILNLSGTATMDDIKTAYRRACSMFHPDRNPAGLEMMKLVNAAYAALEDYVSGTVKTDGSPDAQSYGEEINAALNVIIHLGLEIEVCGAWLWVSGDTKPHREILKTAGFKWASKKLMWNFRPVASGQWNRSGQHMEAKW